MDDISNRSAWLAKPAEDEELRVLRRNAIMGLPCGSEKFIRKIEERTGRNLHVNQIGRPKNVKENDGAKE
jgi:hypothetical protein